MKQPVATHIVSHHELVVSDAMGNRLCSESHSSLGTLAIRLRKFRCRVVGERIVFGCGMSEARFLALHGVQAPFRAVFVDVYQGACHTNAIVLAELLRSVHAARSAAYAFRHGPVPGTGKRGSYRYFRSSIRTADSHREAFYPEDGCFDVPALRPCRNRANLPSERDDIPRCRMRSWKESRRHQWRDGE